MVPVASPGTQGVPDAHSPHWAPAPRMEVGSKFPAGPAALTELMWLPGQGMPVVHAPYDSMASLATNAAIRHRALGPTAAGPGVTAEAEKATRVAGVIDFGNFGHVEGLRKPPRFFQVPEHGQGTPAAAGPRDRA